MGAGFVVVDVLAVAYRSRRSTAIGLGRARPWKACPLAPLAGGRAGAMRAASPARRARRRPRRLLASALRSAAKPPPAYLPGQNSCASAHSLPANGLVRALVRVLAMR